MVFSSLLFIFLFLSLNLLVYNSVKGIQKKNIVLLSFSMVFYAWGGVRYLFLLLAEAAISWFCAVMIEHSQEDGSSGREWMILSTVLLLGLLGIFKYAGFILGGLNTLTGFPSVIPQIALPIGISFYTFQLLSYVVDVYRKEVKAQPKYWKVLLYSSLFHQCIAGPIVRYQTVADEIDHRQVKVPGDMAEGIRRFSVGLAKKAILANACASVADTLLENIGTQAVSGLWLGMIFYMLQIYLDFSAYSDMAIGMGRMVGFHYLENFNYPYIASSIQDFWRRWHISLSSFFRDYVYIPLGGNRKGSAMLVRNMFIVWALTGLWHGASWNYIAWGLYFFIFLVLERFWLKPVLEKAPSFVGHLYALIVVLFGWVLFKFENTNEMLQVFTGMFGAGGRTLSSLAVHHSFLNNLFLLAFSMLACTPFGKRLRTRIYRASAKARKQIVWMYVIDALTPVVLLFLSLCALVGNSYNPFLYFQF